MEAVIVEAVRTPFGRRGGQLRHIRPDALLAHALDGLLERAGLPPDAVGDVQCGSVTQMGEQGANVGRLALLLSKLPVDVPAMTLNRMCGSSQQALHGAAQAVAAGDMAYAIGGGVESMSRVPMFSDIGGGFERLNPALHARHELIHQGESAERIAERWGLSRTAIDDFSAESHRRAVAARPTAELLPTAGHDGEGAPITVRVDEGVREQIDPVAMAGLRPVFRSEGGVVTAGNSSQLSDGASALLVGERSRVAADGLRAKARFLARVVVGSDPTLQLMGVVPATREALRRAGLTMADLDWIEINEAFATVVLAWARELDADMSRVNPWGGAIAHGHPLGATGAGLMAKMVAGLEATDGTLGLQVMCIGHGMATATIIERLGGGVL
ncbi:MAG: thiolase family protein [Anaerolineales bacterium]|nr:thiolase family protein [Anaerolineales bacterium]MCB9128954.1 thiolase family protein [Ardenticatenales bacterium]MCB9172813.1 thiolase family protein [Ardenticatenales bacterium]